MAVADIKRVCPDAVILPSDYETYSLLSKRVWSKNSCGLALIIFQQPPEPFTTLNGAFTR
jgi:hypothetical protein